MPVFLSSDVAPRMYEYPRTMMTVLNAYLHQSMYEELSGIGDELRDRGYRRPMMMIHNTGGMASVLRTSAVNTYNGGPVAGLMGSAYIGSIYGYDNVVATDMGGTSFDIGMVAAGSPRFYQFMPIIDRWVVDATIVDCHSIGAGGGSIARVNELIANRVEVGPESAGSFPGPAAYNQGGTEPTVTDADVVLGLLDPNRFLGGRMELNPDAAASAVGRVAAEAGLELEQAAAGIIRVNSHNAATLIRQRTIEQGLDPREFSLYAFGGAGPLHAFAFAEELGAAEVVIPMGNGASTLSAYGIAATDSMRVFERECSLRAPLDAASLRQELAAAEAEAVAAMVRSGYGEDEIAVDRTAMARYAEQYMHALPLPLPTGPIGDGTVAEVEAAFVAEYARHYGEAAVAVFNAIEVFALRIAVSIAHETPAPAASRSGPGQGATGSREIYWPESGEWIASAIWEGSPPPDVTVAGPAIVQLPHTTVPVAPGQTLRSDEVGNLVLQLRGVR
jgi:N-methylhydantoinase A